MNVELTNFPVSFKFCLYFIKYFEKFEMTRHVVKAIKLKSCLKHLEISNLKFGQFVKCFGDAAKEM
jgi:hypothetical protein